MTHDSTYSRPADAVEVSDMRELVRSERAFQRDVVNEARARGWLVFCTWNSMHSPEGEPDLRLVRPPRIVFAELKVGKNRPTSAQRKALEALRDCPGVESYLWYPRDWSAIRMVLE